MRIYTIKSENKTTTKTISFLADGGSHCSGFLMIDQNRYVDIYAIGSSIKVKQILKTSVTISAPTLDGYTLSVPLDSWATGFFITSDYGIVIS